MAWTDVGICNMALATIGTRVNMITSLSDNSREAQLCQLHYAPTAETLLTEGGAAWRFACKLAALTTTSTQSDHTYAYTLPADCLYPLRLVDTSNNRLVVEPILWRLRGNVIVTDQVSAVLEYIRNDVSVSEYSPVFGDTLALKLAWKLAGFLGASPELEASCFKKYQYQLQVARAQGFNTGEVTVTPGASQMVTER